jgi:hypothetical protein
VTHNRVIALQYASQNVSVFPCRESDTSFGKAKAPYVEGGWHSATSIETQILKWWNAWPDAMVGLPCRMNGIIALDADRHGNGDGVASLHNVFAQHRFNPNSTPCVTTPRNGLHCIFHRSQESGDTKARLAPAIDVRDNAYIIAAGSIMADGRRYSLRDASPEDLAKAVGNDGLPEMPSWLKAMIVKSAPVISAQHNSARESLARSGDLKPRLAGLVRKVVLAPMGERNAVLHWAACRVGEMVKAAAIQEHAAVALLAEAGRQAGLAEREAKATAQSGIKNGRAGAGNG